MTSSPSRARCSPRHGARHRRGAAPASPRQMQNLGTFKAWTAWKGTDANGAICYISSQPQRQRARRASNRDPIHFLIIHRKGLGTKNEVQTLIGYPFNSASSNATRDDRRQGLPDGHRRRSGLARQHRRRAGVRRRRSRRARRSSSRAPASAAPIPPTPTPRRRHRRDGRDRQGLRLTGAAVLPCRWRCAWRAAKTTARHGRPCHDHTAPCSWPPLAALRCSSAGTAAAQSVRLIGDFRDWSAYSATEGAGALCFALTKPTEVTPTPDGFTEAYLYLTNRPAESVQQRVQPRRRLHFRARQPGDGDGRRPELRALHRERRRLAARPGQNDNLAGAIRAGSTLVVDGTSDKGIKITETFSLSGATAASRAIDGAAC